MAQKPAAKLRAASHRIEGHLGVPTARRDSLRQELGGISMLTS